MGLKSVGLKMGLKSVTTEQGVSVTPHSSFILDWAMHTIELHTYCDIYC